MYDGDMMNLDLYVGGMLESYGGPGPLFTKIIKDQFERLRDADRFWFENKENGLFTEEEISALKKLKLSDIILAVTDIQRGHIQENVFLWQTGDPCPQPHQLNATEMDPCMFLKGEQWSVTLTVTLVCLLCLLYSSLQVTTISKGPRFPTFSAASSLSSSPWRWPAPHTESSRS